MRKKSSVAEKTNLSDLSDKDLASISDSDFIYDYISGTPVRSTPEEIEAVQVFARRLVDELGYHKEELFRDPTQEVNQEIYDEYNGKGSLKADDVVVVRDGTYPVGSSALVLEEDLPALFCGGILRLRVEKKSLSPYALMRLLNLPTVRRQMRCKQFTRDVIDTLGPRLFEVRVPPPSSETAKSMPMIVGTIMGMKGEIKTLMTKAIDPLEPAVPASAVGRPGWSMR
jgi:hypothetical protein